MPLIFRWHKLALAAILLVILGFLMAPVFAGSTHISPVALNLGPFAIHWYGLTMAVGIIASAFVALKVARPQIGGINEDQLQQAIVWVTLGGLVGARLLFVVLKWPLYVADPVSILYINEGGLSLHGSWLGGLVAALAFAVIQKISTFKLTDIISIAMPIGQIIGRFGNFFNQEAYGGATGLPWKMYIAPEFRPVNLKEVSYFHPTFLYEAILLVILYGILRYFLDKKPAAGQLTAIYLGGYSVIRFFIEYFRIDSDQLGPLSIAQWASLAILSGSIIWYYRIRVKRI